MPSNISVSLLWSIDYMPCNISVGLLWSIYHATYQLVCCDLYTMQHISWSVVIYRLYTMQHISWSVVIYIPYNISVGLLWSVVLCRLSVWQDKLNKHWYPARSNGFIGSIQIILPVCCQTCKYMVDSIDPLDPAESYWIQRHVQIV